MVSTNTSLNLHRLQWVPRVGVSILISWANEHQIPTPRSTKWREIWRRLGIVLTCGIAWYDNDISMWMLECASHLVCDHGDNPIQSPVMGHQPGTRNWDAEVSKWSGSHDLTQARQEAQMLSTYMGFALGTISSGASSRALGISLESDRAMWITGVFMSDHRPTRMHIQNFGCLPHVKQDYHGASLSFHIRKWFFYAFASQFPVWNPCYDLPWNGCRTPRLMDFPHRYRRLLGGLCWAQAANLCSVSGYVLLGGRPGMPAWVAWVSGAFSEELFFVEAEENEKGITVFDFDGTGTFWGWEALVLRSSILSSWLTGG